MPSTKEQEVVISLKMKDDVVREQLAALKGYLGDMQKFLDEFHSRLNDFNTYLGQLDYATKQMRKTLSDLLAQADRIEDWFEIKTEAKE